MPVKTSIRRPAKEPIPVMQMDCRRKRSAKQFKYAKCNLEYAFHFLSLLGFMNPVQSEETDDVYIGKSGLSKLCPPYPPYPP